MATVRPAPGPLLSSTRTCKSDKNYNSNDKIDSKFINYKGGWKKARIDRWKQGRKKASKEGKKDRRKQGRKQGQKEGRKQGRRDESEEESKEGRK